MDRGDWGFVFLLATMGCWKRMGEWGGVPIKDDKEDAEVDAREGVLKGDEGGAT